MTTDPEWWAVADCAAHLDVTMSTWRSYVARQQAPAPTYPEGIAGPRWRPETVRTWAEARPRRRGRPRKATTPPDPSKEK